MNKAFLNRTEGALELGHRGLAFGDGLFETIRVENGSAQFLDEHLARLRKGAQALFLPLTNKHLQSLEAFLRQLSSQIDSPHALKIVLVRNSPGRGYGFAEDQSIDEIILLQPYSPPDWQHGAVVTMAETPISENERLGGIKHLNRLDSVLARHEARLRHVDEVLMAKANGDIVDGSMTNVFVKINDRWITPPITNAGVSGIIRNQILSANSQVVVSAFSQADVANVQQGF